MTIRLLDSNILDADAQVLLVTAGTERPPAGRRATDVLGSIGAQLLRRLGEEGAEELEAQLEVPVAEGAVQTLEVEPTDAVRFAWVLVLGALSHLDANHRKNIARALGAALQVARKLQARRVALALPTGGWRTDAATAAWAVLDATHGLDDLEVEVFCRDPRQLEVARSILY